MMKMAMITRHMNNLGAGKVIVFDEPTLQFANGQDAEDPHDGLSLFGPFSLHEPSHPRSPSHIVIGPEDCVERFKHWSKAMNLPAMDADAKKHRLWPPYPGFEAAFGSRWNADPALTIAIDNERLMGAARKKDAHERCFAVVELFMEGFKKIPKLDFPVTLIFCVIPDEVWQNCRPLSRIAQPTDDGISARDKKSRKAGQLEIFTNFNIDQYHYSPDFRRQLKARTMKYGVPLQILRSSTLRLTESSEIGERGLTPLSDRMWNIGTAIYYKAGGKPWRLNSAREGVCYIGIAFKFLEGKKNSACCAAQMFLDSGDGIVFLGDDRPIYSPDKKQFYLSKDASKKLLTGILETYRSWEGRPLKEIFLHSRSRINGEQWDGYQAACPSDVKLVGVSVRPERYGPRLYRIGNMPVLRGTFWKIDEKSGYLYCSGFKPRLATYDGWETPVPLNIKVQYGEAPIEVVAKDILGLTKLNYNACKLGESQPVTVKFSDAVGEILISNPTVTDHRPNFKFYI
jgi:hypothetical protein